MGVHGFDLARDAVVELQVLVCECVRSEVAQIVDSLRCVSEGAKHSGVNFPGFAVLTKALLNRTGLPALSTVELLVDITRREGRTPALRRSVLFCCKAHGSRR
jgi:hypothetical protein